VAFYTCTPLMHCSPDFQLKYCNLNRQRDQKLQQEHREKLEQQRQAYVLEQDKLRRSHSQAADMLHLKIEILEARLRDGIALGFCWYSMMA
jgi:hypothetical protein